MKAGGRLPRSGGWHVVRAGGDQRDCVDNKSKDRLRVLVEEVPLSPTKHNHSFPVS